MKRLVAALLVCLVAFAAPPQASARLPVPSSALSGEVIIKLLPNLVLSPDAQPTKPTLVLGDRLRALGANAARPLGATTYRVGFQHQRSGEALARELAGLPEVVYAEPNYGRTILRTPSDPLFGQQWHLSNIQAPAAWERTTGTSILVAVLDTGVSPTHPDLQGRIGAGRDLFNGDGDPRDDEGHGTHVAGLIAANGNNGVGGAGVCWNCVILPVKVLGARGRGNDATIAAGIRYAVDQGARVISMSLGGPEESRTLRDAVAYAAERNVLMVAASGNDGTRGTQLNYPAAYPGVIAVSATDERDALATFSTSGDFVDIAAPGVNILSTFWSPRGDTYAVASGTSEAAPLVTGAAALLFSTRPELTALQAAELLEASVDDVDVPGRDAQTGYGRLNAARAVELAAAPDALSRSRIEGRIVGVAQVVVTLNTGVQAQPDANGVYRFENLPPGNYTVVARGPDGQQRIGQASLSGTSLSVVTLDFDFGPGSDAFAPVAPPPPGQTDFFVETNHTLRGALREYWQHNGGLPVFGFPISEETIEIGGDGQPYTVQYFERNRFELHPENQPPYNVLLGRLGDDTLRQQGRDWFAFPRGAPAEGCVFFAETGHSICGAFLDYWRANGLQLDNRAATSTAESLALFGLPLSEPQVETFPDGSSYLVQWFERARFEDHGSNGVLLGLLGRETTGR